MRAEPVDFDAFWLGLAERAHLVDPKVEFSGPPGRIRRVRFASTGGLRPGAWLVHPDGPVRSAVVVSHGYGGRTGVDLEADLAVVPEGAIALFPVCRGLPELSLLDGVGATAHDHVLHGIESRETYIHAGCVQDIWCAISALESIVGQPLGERRGGLRLGLQGSSFGGGMAVMAAPWDERVDALSLQVPSFGDHEARLATACIGSGDAVRAWVEHHPEALEVLDYFDAAFAARRLRIPTIVAAAREDPVVPPVGQWAVADNVPPQHRTALALTAGHQEHPEQDAELAHLAALTRDLFTAPSQEVNSAPGG